MPEDRNHDTENCLRTILSNEGYQLSPMRNHGETGVDIIAKKDNQKLHIEVIGYKRHGSTRAKDFYEVFFRSISRLKDGAIRCVIAMPSLAGGEVFLLELINMELHGNGSAKRFRKLKFGQ